METDVLIIGAGPYGISLAYDLYLRKVPFVLVGKPFSLWLHHLLPNIQLRSDWRASQLYSRDGYLSLERYLSAYYSPSEGRRLTQHRIACTLFSDYLHWLLRELPFTSLDEKVELLERQGEGFVARTQGGREIHARRVVCATGIEGHRYLPESLAHMPHILHGWQVAEYQHLQKKRLLVVGGGQSAAEAIAHLAPQNEMVWVHRSPLIFFSEPINLPKPLFSLALRLSGLFYRLPPRLCQRLGRRFVESTITPEFRSLLLQDNIQRLQADVASLDLTESSSGGLHARALGRDFDQIIACTGYRYALATMGFLAPALRKEVASREEIPLLNRHYETSVRNLFMIGGIAEPTHGPAQRFMFGCRDATKRVGAALA